MNNKFDNPVIILAASCLAMCGAYLFDLLPLIVSEAGSDFGFTNTQLGDLASSVFIGFTLAALSSIFWIRSVNWKLSALVGAAFLVLPLFIGSQQITFYAIYFSLLVAGIGSGVLYALATAIFGESSNTDRAFGIKLGFESVPGAIGMLIIPFYLAEIGFKELSIIFAISIALLCCGIFFIPSKGEKVYQSIEKTLTSTKWTWVYPVLGLISCFFYFTSFAGTWAFVERMGSESQVPSSLIGLIASFGFVISVIGGFAAAVIGDRFGRVPPMIAAYIIFAISLYFLGTFTNSIEFALGVSLFMLLLNFILAYIVGVTATVDVSGKLFVLTAAAISTGAIAGPAIAGRLVDTYGYASMLTFSGLTGAFSLVLYLMVTRKAKYI